eukprot:UN08441
MDSFYVFLISGFCLSFHCHFALLSSPLSLQPGVIARNWIMKKRKKHAKDAWRCFECFFKRVKY